MSKLVYDQAVNAWKRITRDRAPEPFTKQVDLFNRMLNVFHVGEYFYFILNVVEAKFEYCDPAVTTVLGYEPDQIPLEVLFQNIHPDDLPSFLRFENEVVEFFRKLTPEKIQKYKARYNYRLLNKAGVYKQMLQQVVTIQSDDEGNVLRTLVVMTDISSLKTDATMSLSILGLDGEPSYQNILSFDNTDGIKNPLTHREIQVLQLLAKGRTSKQIAKSLSLSEHTVKNHRKNMLRKTGTTSSTALLSMALENAWIK